MKANRSVSAMNIQKASLMSDKIQGSISSKREDKMDSTFRQLVDDDMTDKGDVTDNNIETGGGNYDTQRNLLNDEDQY